MTPNEKLDALAKLFLSELAEVKAKQQAIIEVHLLFINLFIQTMPMTPEAREENQWLASKKYVEFLDAYRTRYGRELDDKFAEALGDDEPGQVM